MPPVVFQNVSNKKLQKTLSSFLILKDSIYVEFFIVALPSPRDLLTYRYIWYTEYINWCMVVSPSCASRRFCWLSNTLGGKWTLIYANAPESRWCLGWMPCFQDFNTFSGLQGLVRWYPIPSMGLVYLPTFGWFWWFSWCFHVGKYTIVPWMEKGYVWKAKRWRRQVTPGPGEL